MQSCTVEMFLVQSISPFMSVSQQIIVVQVMNTTPSYDSIMTNLPLTFSVSPSDYGAVDTLLTFAACVKRSCVNVSIVDDTILENVESFDVNLKRTPDLDRSITLAPVDGVVEIIDNDGRHDYYILKCN